MDFDAAWSTFSPGDYVAVSDGNAMPSRVGGLAWRHWRSHNFVGRLAAKAGSAPRRTLHFDLAADGPVTVAYTVAEGVGHSFALSDADAFAANVFGLL